MNKVDLIIPSFDRACQLDLLLNSLHKNWLDKSVKIHILYRYSEEKFLCGYQLLEKYWPHIVMHKEENFAEQIKDLVNNSKTVGFFTDDTIMFKEPHIFPEKIPSILFENRGITFSLRLGINTKVQNYLDGSLQPSLIEQAQKIDNDNQCIRWKWNRFPACYNYGYIFSWDGHFYDSEWLYQLIKDKSFENPRALEHQLSIDPHLRDGDLPYMISCDVSSVFVNTVNRVQADGPPAGTKYNYSAEFLNRWFLVNQRINPDSYLNLPLQSCHEEFPIIWETNNGIHG